MVKDYYLISDAAKLVDVESHVLRYWEEELQLPIKRNELGHRYYTKKDVERFKEIKELKEQGLQLKAIRMFLKDGKLSVEIPETVSEQGVVRENAQHKLYPEDQAAVLKNMMDNVKDKQETLELPEKTAREKAFDLEETKAEKARRLQWLLQQMLAETLRENNQELCQDIRESVVKELDYQFRLQEQREDAREQARGQREDEYYQKLDELLRLRSKKKFINKKEEKKEKRKRHSIF